MNKYADLINELDNITNTDDINDSVLLVDGMNNFIRSFAANNQMDSNGNLIGGVAGFLKTVGYSIRHLNPTRVFIVFDGKGGNTRRRKIFPNYKKKSDLTQKYNRFYTGSKIDEKHNMKWQFMILLNLLDCLPVKTISIDYLEGDDVISFISNNLKVKSNKIYINSTDKDFLQLVDDKVSVWNPQKKQIYDPETISEEYNIDSSNFIIYKSVLGDSSDNIDGIKGIGEKTLQTKFSILSEQPFVSIDKFIDFCQEHENESAKFKKILKNKEILIRNKRLMDLTNNDIMSSNLIYKVKDLVDDENVAPLNKKEFISILNQYYISDSFVNDVNYWLSSTFNGLSSFSN